VLIKVADARREIRRIAGQPHPFGIFLVL